jgi:nucleotide-binding universal stress UspA family protein
MECRQMTYGAVLVHAGAAPENEPRLALAANVANDFGAVLIGVGAEVSYPVVIGGFGETMAEVGEAAVTADLKAAESAFHQAAKAVRKGSEWRCERTSPEVAMARHSRAADLIVAGPHKTFDIGLYGSPMPGELLMQCGRPLLLAPPKQTRLDADSIVIGWKDTRETHRAVSDSLPFLKKAAQVLLVGICEGDQDKGSLKAELADVAAALGRHGVKATTAVRPKPGSGVADDLMHVAEVQQAGLLVIGGYGHSRLREWVFGGVTQELLTNPTRPVLVSR